MRSAPRACRRAAAAAQRRAVPAFFQQFPTPIRRETYRLCQTVALHRAAVCRDGPPPPQNNPPPAARGWPRAPPRLGTKKGARRRAAWARRALLFRPSGRPLWGVWGSQPAATLSSSLGCGRGGCGPGQAPRAPGGGGRGGAPLPSKAWRLAWLGGWWVGTSVPLYAGPPRPSAGIATVRVARFGFSGASARGRPGTGLPGAGGGCPGGPT
jgi:hypothetical protein